MSSDLNSKPIHQPRRLDRAIEDETWIQNYLAAAPFGDLATELDGQPFIMPNTFVYDPQRHALYLHTAAEGRARFNIERNPRVCFSVSEMGRLLPSPTAGGVSVEYQSVIVFGQADILTNPDEAATALQLLLDKYFPHLQPGRDYRPIQPQELSTTAVFKVAIQSWSAKRKAAPADFPGAFRYGDQNQA